MASPTSPSGADVPPVLPSIPLSPEPLRRADDKSIGALVTDVTTQLSNLVRAEVELAKAEVTAEVRKGVTGSVFFAVAAAIGLFSLFFFFFTFAELLVCGCPAGWRSRSSSSLMVLVAALFGLLGYRKVRKIRKPERTIESLRESAQMLQHRGPARGPGRAGRPQRVGALTGTPEKVLRAWRRGRPGRAPTHRRSGCPVRGTTATSPRTASACTSRSAVPRAPLVVLLHGFPEFWWTWRRQLPALADAGFRAVAVDLRGYGDSDKPPRGYDLWTLAGDVAGLIRALGERRRGSSATAGAA